MKKEIRIGTRGSQLALKQADLIAEELRRHFPGIALRIVKIKTTGDKILDSPLSAIGGKGLFIKEIEEALLRDDIDIAVHSMKDMPAELADGLIIGAVTQREDPRDALITRDGSGLKSLAPGAKLGTSSLRRQAQLRHLRPDIEVVPLRGNLDTRLRKLKRGDFDAIVVAAAGLARMGWADEITEYLDPECCLPAIGQGSLGIEVRRGDAEILKIVEKLNHSGSMKTVSAERALLRKLQGDCQVPIAALGSIEGARLTITAMVANIDGSKKIVQTISGDASEPGGLGIMLAQRLIDSGAGEILDSIYRTSSTGEKGTK